MINQTKIVGIQISTNNDCVWIIILLQNGLQVESVQSIRDKALSDEICQLKEALLERCIFMAGVSHHLLVVPDFCVDSEEVLLDPILQRKSAGEEEKAVVISERHFSILEHTCWIVSLFVAHINVNTNDNGAGGDHRRSVVQENWLVHSELAYLKGHFHQQYVLWMTKQVQESVHRVNRPREMQVKTKLD